MSVTRYELGPTMSKGVEFHHLIFLTGLTADDGSVRITGQTGQVLAKVDNHLAEAGGTKCNILSAIIYITGISLRPELNEVWNTWIDSKNLSTRASVGEQLAGDTLVEIIVTSVDVGVGGHGHGRGHSH